MRAHYLYSWDDHLDRKWSFLLNIAKEKVAASFFLAASSVISPPCSLRAHECNFDLVYWEREESGEEGREIFIYIIIVNVAPSLCGPWALLDINVCVWPYFWDLNAFWPLPTSGWKCAVSVWYIYLRSRYVRRTYLPMFLSLTFRQCVELLDFPHKNVAFFKVQL